MVQASVRPGRPGGIGRTPYPRVNEVVLEGPERRRGPAADAGLLVDVLDVVPDGLGRDAEILGDRLVRLAAHEHEEDFQLALGQPGGQLARSLAHAVAGGASTASTASGSSRPSSASRISSASAAGASSAGLYGRASRMAP